MTRSDESSHAAAGITPIAISDAALTIVREVGIDGLTMRNLAARLGIRAPSLYHHIRNRAELLSVVAKHAFATYGPQVEGYEQARSLDDWIAVTRSFAVASREFYLAHPGLAAVVLAETTPNRDREGGSRATIIRAELAALHRLGVPGDIARHTYEAGARWVLGAVVAEELAPTPGEGDATIFHAGLDLLLSGTHTRLSHMSSRLPETSRHVP